LRFFDHLIEERFAKPEHREVFHVAEEPEGVLAYLEAFVPAEIPEKYF
jgi:predicted Rossmann-fold nucleotide-binding protein